MAISPCTNVSSCVDSSDLNDSTRWLFIILGAVSWLNGIFGNSMVLCTLAIRSGLKSPHNVFIGHLTLADLFIVGYGLPFWVWDLATDSHPTVNASHCTANGYLGFTCSVASILFLWSISCNRYISVCHHAVYRKWQVTSWKAAWFCVAVWVISAVSSTFPFYGPGSYIYQAKGRVCFLNRSDIDSHAYISITIPAVIILATIAFFNFSIFRFWRLNKKRVSQWVARTAPLSSTRITQPLRPPSSQDSNSNNDSGDMQNSNNPSVTTTSPCDRRELRTTDQTVTTAPTGEAGWVSTPSQMTTELLSACPEVTEPKSSETVSVGNLSSAPSASEYYNNSCEKVSPLDSRFLKSTSLALENSASISAPNVTNGLTSQPHCSSESAMRGSKITQQSRHPPLAARGSRSSNSRGLVRSLLAVYLCLVALYLTSVVLGALAALVKVPQEMSLLSNFLFFTNSSINWLLYSAFNKSFRQDCHYVMTRCCCYKSRWRSRKVGHSSVAHLS